MDFYDPAFTQQPAPLVAFSLGSGPEAECLKTYLEKAQLTTPYWDNVIIKNRLLAAKFHIRCEASEALIEQKITAHKCSGAAGTHSLLSPFNSKSDLFPSGVISSKWFRKYTSDVPFAVVCAYSLGPDHRNDTVLAEKLQAVCKKYTGFNTRFVAIVISSPAENRDVLERFSHLRQLLGLANLSGLFHLALLAETMENDCEILASSLLNTLKTSARDFYSEIELRVKQRFKKYYTMPRSETKTSIELSPKILETRNMIKQGILLQLMHPHNVQQSLQILEFCYDSLLDLFSKNASHFFSKSRTPHDRKVYVQWRTLLDVIAIHIVRGYFSIEEPVVAMKKHRAHIRVVEQVLDAHNQPGTRLWIAAQYHWLAQLLALIPSSVLQKFHGDSFQGKGKKSDGSIEYFGGLLTPDKSVITTSLNLLYKAAADGLQGIDEATFRSEIFQGHFASLADITAYRIRLLELARERKSSSDSASSAPLASLEIHLLCEIADSYVGLNDLERGMQYYELVQKQCSFPAKSNIYRFIAERIARIAEKLENSQTALKQLASLSLTGSHPIKSPIQGLDLSDSSVIDLDNGFPFASVEVSLFNQSLDDEVRVSDTIVIQNKVDSSFTSRVFEKAVPGCKSVISLNYIDIHCESDTLVRLNGSGTQSDQIQVAFLADNQAEFNFSAFGEKLLIFHLKHEASRVGWFLIDALDLSLSVTVKSNGRETVMNKMEHVAIDHRKIKHVFDLYQAGTNGEVLTKVKALKGRSPCKLYVKPYRPKLTIGPEPKSASIIIGEKFMAPLLLSFPEIASAQLRCKSVRISVESILYDDMIESKDLHAQVNWDLLKDDETMELLEEIHANLKESKHILHVSITRSPSSQIPEEKRLKIVLYFKLLVTSKSLELLEFDITQLDFEILPTPFSQAFDISPRFHEDTGSSSIPNPFVVVDDENTSEGFSMPLLSRTWMLKAQIDDTHDFLRLKELHVTKAILHVRLTNPGVTSTCQSAISHNDTAYTREFFTSSKHGPTTASVTVFASASFHYTRKASVVENVYETEETEFVLPLQEPKVFLRVETIDGEQKVHLAYIIENPTSRIFMFASTLSADRATSQGLIWLFEDIRNEWPLKQMVIPVLPFSQHVLEYYADYSLDGETPGTIELPQLQVYDMHYKVNLPTLSLQESVQVTESGIVLEL